jgi:hypothetical protein
LKKEEGMEEYPQNFIFDIAQVILQPDEQRVVRLNEEVMALANAKHKEGMKKAMNLFMKMRLSEFWIFT